MNDYDPQKDTLENAITYMKWHYEFDNQPMDMGDCLDAPPVPFWIKHDMEQCYRRGFTHGLAAAVEILDDLKDKGFVRVAECSNIIDNFNVYDCYRWRYRVWEDLSSGDFKKWHSHPELKQESWWSLRLKVFQRDGKACSHCGSVKKVQVDHIKSVAYGGLPVLENLQPLCKKCNLKKGVE